MHRHQHRSPPPLAAWTTVAFTYVTLGYVGYRIGRTKHEELFGLIGLKPRAAGAPDRMFVVDTSALIDGRILDLVETGFLSGDVLVHAAVLRELQTIADSSDSAAQGSGAPRPGRARRAEACPARRGPSDRGGRRRRRGCRPRAARPGTGRVARDHRPQPVQGRPGRRRPRPEPERPRQPPSACRSASATSSRSIWSRTGASRARPSGYLDDGTMVVVEQAHERIGSDTAIVVRNVIKTTTGRMVFASLQ